jgi:hypothetical protein
LAVPIRSSRKTTITNPPQPETTEVVVIIATTDQADKTDRVDKTDRADTLVVETPEVETDSKKGGLHLLTVIHLKKKLPTKKFRIN